MLCRGWTSHAYLDSESVKIAAEVVSCASLVIVTVLLDALPDFFLHCICRGSIHDHQLRLQPTVRCYCDLQIILKIYLHPQQNAVTPWQYCRFCGLLQFLHLSPIADIGGAAGGISPPRRSPPCAYISSHSLSSLFVSPSLLVPTQIRSHVVGSSPPSFHFYGEKDFSPFFPRRLASNRAYPR